MAPITCVGKFGGFVRPFLVGWIKGATGDFENGFHARAGLVPLAAGSFCQAGIEHTEHVVPLTVGIEV